MNTLLLQIDGKMPNLALMKISAHHKNQGHNVVLKQMRRPYKDASPNDADGLYLADFDSIYASLLFTKSQDVARRVLELRPDAIVGGTGWNFGTLDGVGIPENVSPDYSIYPSFSTSLGFSQRGCRLNCSFCVVPKKEGHVRDEATINEIWRGDPWPRHVILLDNDFFGSPTWKAKIEEMRSGKFKVSLSQGINARMLSDEAAAALASIDYRDDSMERKRIYTAWDSIGDEGPLFRGLNALVKHGVKPDHIMVYMLVGYNKPTLEEADFIRHKRLREFGCKPYPMPYTRTTEMIGFQRWIIGAYDKRFPWKEWEAAKYRPEKLGKLP